MHSHALDADFSCSHHWPKLYDQICQHLILVILALVDGHVISLDFGRSSLFALRQVFSGARCGGILVENVRLHEQANRDGNDKAIGQFIQPF